MINIEEERYAMIRLVATDMDGTLLREDKTFSDAFFNVYHKMREKGIYFVVASGNQYELLVYKFAPIKDEIVFISENGTKIMHLGKEIYVNTMDPIKVKEILKIVAEYPDCMVILCGRKHAYILNTWKKHKEFIDCCYKNYLFVENFDDIDDIFLKLSVSDWTNQVKETVAQIASMVPVGIRIVASGNQWFDIFNDSIHKGKAMEIVQAYLGVSRKECVAFGDQMNDYELLLSVEESYCMANGDEELKKVAKHVCLSNEEDGVIKVLEKII